MNDTVSVDFQFSIKPQGRGARKRMVEKTGTSEETKPLERIPRIARYMALAIHFEGLIKKGVVTDFADLARLGHVTRARVTQIMNLRLLAPEIQEDILLSECKRTAAKLVFWGHRACKLSLEGSPAVAVRGA